jgi:uncharacterized protein (DUF305 family)
LRSTSFRAIFGGGKSPRRRDPLLLPLALLAALTVAAVFAVYLSARPPGDNSVEAGFARDMSVHHAQAVEMAEIVRDKTESDEIRILATDIALTQQAQIGQMRGWLDVWGLAPTGSEPAMAWMGHPTEGRMPGMATPEEINRLRQASPGEADRLFLRLMIPHHRAAIPMAESALEETREPVVEDLARSIAAAQSGEIKVMEDLLRKRGAEPPAGAGSHDHHGGHG